jgi:hypothetical protein
LLTPESRATNVGGLRETDLQKSVQTKSRKKFRLAVSTSRVTSNLLGDHAKKSNSGIYARYGNQPANNIPKWGIAWRTSF